MTVAAWIATVAAWIACGALAAATAWLARPYSYPGGPASAAATGMFGGFLGGETVIMTAGALPALSIYGAAVGAIVLLDLAERTSRTQDGPPRSETLARLWSWAILVDPVLLAALIGITLAVTADSPLLGTLVAVATICLIYWQRNHGTYLPRRSNRPGQQR